MRLKDHIKSLEKRIIRQRPTELRSAEDVLADLRISGMPRVVAQARCIARLEPYAHDPHVDEELRDACREQILAIAKAMRAEDLRDAKLNDHYRENADFGEYQSDIDVALRAVEAINNPLAD